MSNSTILENANELLAEKRRLKRIEKLMADKPSPPEYPGYRAAQSLKDIYDSEWEVYEDFWRAAFHSATTEAEIKVIITAMEEHHMRMINYENARDDLFDTLEAMGMLVHEPSDTSEGKYVTRSKVFMVSPKTTKIEEKIFVIWSQSLSGSYHTDWHLSDDDYSVHIGAEKEVIFRVGGIEISLDKLGQENENE